MKIQAKEILYAVKNLGLAELQEVTPSAIKKQLNLSNREWQSGYNKTFSAMRVGSNTYLRIGQKYRNVFEKVYHGCYYLTDYGETVICSLEDVTNEAETAQSL